MKKDLKYKIQFFSEWQCGSGLAAGADVDVLAIKDKNNLPFVPGKTIKGLVREALETIYDMKGEDKSDICSIFGNAKDKNVIKKLKDDQEAYVYLKQGDAFFTNAVIDAETVSDIMNIQASKYLYRSVSSTAILDNGIAENHSLRKVETVVPLTLHGEIKYIPEEMVDKVETALHFIKRIGYGRNRGFGRCNIEKEA
jgi:CRISPR/Cas system CSM-associated protein Csm3 (group 7 of RAMP superfamily)